MRRFCASFTSAASSSNEASFSIALSARARYMAPLSRFTYPNFRARRDAIVLLPAPAGPSMAIVILRGAGLLVEWSFIVKLKIVQDGRRSSVRWPEQQVQDVKLTAEEPAALGPSRPARCSQAYPGLANNSGRRGSRGFSLPGQRVADRK